MKTFKRIYYPILALLFCLVLVLGFTNATVGNKSNKLGNNFVADVRGHLDTIAASSHNSVYQDRQEAVREYIRGKLVSTVGLAQGSSYEDEGEMFYDFAVLDGKPIATVVLQKDTLSVETLQLIDSDRDDDAAIWEVDKEITNIVVYIPGQTTIAGYNGEQPKATGDVVMMMAHYDSGIEGAGASNNGTQVAAMLQTIIHIADNNMTFDNDLLFVFTDASEEGMYGAYMFKNQFNGFDNLFSRIGLGVNFDALGNKGTLAMLQSSEDNYSLISAYGKINGNTLASSIVNTIYGGANTYSDFDIYGEIPSLSFANIGGRDVNRTSFDSIANVEDSQIIQQSNMIYNVVNTFGSYKLDTLESDSNAVYFSYLDAFMIVYSYAASYVLGALIILLIVGIAVINHKKKVFSWTKTGSGVAVQLLSIVAAVICLFLLYYLISLFVAAMGLIPVRAIGKLIVESMGLLIAFMALSAIISGYLTIVFRKLFNVKSSDIVRGNVLIWAFFGVVLAFVAPQLSYFFAIAAVLELVVLLLVVLLSEKFKNKYKQPIGILFPYLIPMLIVVPMVVPVMAAVSMTLRTMYIPLLTVLFMLMTGFITPYSVLLKKHMQRIVLMLPRPSIRVQKEITETVEDKAKKGRFVEKKSIVVVKEKYNPKYHHAHGAAILAAIFIIIAIVFSSVGFRVGKNYGEVLPYREAINNNSMVLVWEKVDTNTENAFLRVNDFITYRYVDEAIGGFSWSFDEEAYTKDLYATANIIKGSPTVNVSGTDYNFTVYSPERSLVSLELKNTEKLTKLVITSSSGESFEYENTDKKNTIIVNIPYKFGSFSMSVEGVDNITLEYTEYLMDIGSSVANLAELEEWRDLMEYYVGEGDITENISSGIIFRIIKNNF